MPIYENRSNAENRVELGTGWQQEVLVDREAVLSHLLDGFRVGSGAVLAVDGWYAVDWEGLATMLCDHLERRGHSVCRISATSLFQQQEAIDAYRTKFLTDDPAFGWVNRQGTLADIQDETLISATVAEVKSHKAAGTFVLIHGNGAVIPQLRHLIDRVVYAEMTIEPMMWKMWNGELISFGRTTPKTDYWWKEYYYCDFYLLHSQRKYVQGEMDYFLEAIDLASPKLVSRAAFDAALDQLSRAPIKEVRVYSPGPWGAYRFKDYWDIPGLKCNAWNRLASPDLAILADFGDNAVIEMQFLNLMRHQDRIVGKKMATRYPDLFPVEIFLDDGFFADEQPAERTSMPMHNHPDTDYVKRHFNEQLGRYETYYIAEAYEGSSTWMGFTDDAEIEEWQRRCFESWKTGEPIGDWQEYIANWSTNVGDLFYIPPGITHGHGGNQMVLEMDTCPSVSATEYSFFGYDFVRSTWDDTTGTMTGKPMKMHMEHYVDNEKGFRETFVRDHLRVRPKVFRFKKSYWLDRYDSYGPMPFLVERLHFNGRGEYSTEGRFMHVATLTVGSRVVVRSLNHSERSTQLEFYQSVIIPADFGDYEVVSAEPGRCTFVIMRFRDGVA